MHLPMNHTLHGFLALKPSEGWCEEQLAMFSCKYQHVFIISCIYSLLPHWDPELQMLYFSTSIPLFIPRFLRLLKNSQLLLSENIMIPVQVRKKKRFLHPGRGGGGGEFHNDLGRAPHLSSYFVACSDRTPWTQMCFAIQSCVLWSRREDWGLSWHSFQELTYYYYQNSGFPLKCLFLQIK